MLTSRLYHAESDLTQMKALLMEARSRTNDWHYLHAGQMMWEFLMRSSPHLRFAGLARSTGSVSSVTSARVQLTAGRD